MVRIILKVEGVLFFIIYLPADFIRHIGKGIPGADVFLSIASNSTDEFSSNCKLITDCKAFLVVLRDFQFIYHCFGVVLNRNFAFTLVVHNQIVFAETVFPGTYTWF